jgi:hypothetical protein
MKPKRIVFVLLVLLAGLTVVTLAQDDADSKIADAMSAGPASIAENATIMDWPDAEGAEMTVLREGTNGWVCYPSTPAVVAGNLYQDSMCLDEVWQGWLEALMAGESLTIERLGIAYMLSGDAGLSNIDPAAAGPTDDNDWHVSGPHVMLLMPGLDYEGVSTDHESGDPYVMWRDTPYAHIMVRVSGDEAHP